jgi:hypothetical protein
MRRTHTVYRDNFLQKNLRDELEENNYFVVENFLHPGLLEEIAKSFKKHCIEKFKKPDPQVPGSPASYGWSVAEHLLRSKIFLMNDLVGERLYPTYAYARWYKMGAELKPHIDAEACEISVTLNISGDAWPIFIKKPDGSSASITLRPGEAMIYKGMTADHWREKFTGVECIQIFLHYVKTLGPNYFHAFDLIRNPKGPSL